MHKCSCWAAAFVASVAKLLHVTTRRPFASVATTCAFATSTLRRTANVRRSKTAMRWVG
ncbi:hypothetical protein EMIHUDRAFT_216625 [Emiliania huxleyi CCMP1516]|uniref:Secreted protein n=2 Tax=Emiliania huxleyi TaxID=2903 RepID=A0A0D3IDB8_EMIH1|nr:hypothetical protein EMIHUDRAFT_216625 [Emiliania huxleyi CCMP1516]EOD09253.1 hypothetical protein EMIHUDRAFT_216625 [Emiliania huxleyi CCMP1516]|eukprot:XP_005761682.1 hypothetical protein EMIHUDRAFT_216625 [Emiliania huxleyi CCMP1516]